MSFDAILLIAFIFAAAAVIHVAFDARIMGWIVSYFGKREE